MTTQQRGETNLVFLHRMTIYCRKEDHLSQADFNRLHTIRKRSEFESPIRQLARTLISWAEDVQEKAIGYTDHDGFDNPLNTAEMRLNPS